MPYTYTLNLLNSAILKYVEKNYLKNLNVNKTS